MRGPPHGGACCGCAWPPSLRGVLCCCVAPRMVRHALVVCGPPHGGVCCVGAGVCVVVGGLVLVGCVLAWPGRAGWPPERVWCATPFVWLGQTGRPPELLRCTTPCCCFAGCRHPAARDPLFALRFPVSARLLAGCLLLSPLSCAPSSPRVLPRGCRRRAVVLCLSSPYLLVPAAARPPAPPPLRLVPVAWVFCYSFSCARAPLCPCCVPFFFFWAWRFPAQSVATN